MQVYYDDPSHTYYTVSPTGEKTYYTSATTLINKYKKPFDTDAIAIGYAKKHGETPAYWKAKWAEKRDNACAHGTAIHKNKEDLITPFAPRPIKAVEQLIDYSTLPEGIYPELKLWHHDYKVAGRSDKCTIHSVLGVRYMDIEDYKTNEDLLKPAYVNYWGETSMMLPPIQQFSDCKMNHYTLQLSLYQFMAESLGFAAGKRVIIHIRDGIEQTFEVPYLRNAVINLLNDYIKSNGT